LITIATSYPKICVTILLKRRQPWAVRIPPNPQIRFRYFSKNIETGRPIRFGWWCFKAMLDLEPDCILGFLNRFGLVAVAAKYWFALLKQRRVCALISQESLLSAYLTQHESWIFKYLARLVYRLASKVIVLTYATKEDLKKNFNVPTRKIIYLPGWLPQ
jgi:hypothetical protein